MKFLLLIIHFFSMIFFGSVVIVSIGAHFNGDWAKDLRRFIPLLKTSNWIWGMCLVVLLIFGKHYYPWEEFNGHRAMYFTPNLLISRTILYFILSTLTLRLIEKKPYLPLMAFFFIGNFFSFDWGMSLEKEWISNMYGLIYMSNGTLAAMTIMTLFSFPRLSLPARSDYVHFMLTSAITWFYLHLGQFVIMWTGNLPREATFYLERWETWGSSILFIAVLIKLIPLTFVSLFKDLKQNARIVGIISALIFMACALEVVWLVRYP